MLCSLSKRLSCSQSLRRNFATTITTASYDNHNNNIMDGESLRNKGDNTQFHSINHSINKRGLIWGKYDTTISGEEIENKTTMDKESMLYYHHNKKIDEMIRVDHAGEFGAITICHSQLYVLSGDPVITDILEQEKSHFHKFESMIHERRVRPTVLRPIWNLSGTIAGIVTALMGREAAMACHQAVEEVISDHYNTQLRDIYDLNQSSQQKDLEFEQMMQDEKQEDAQKTEDYFFTSPAMKSEVRNKEEELRNIIRQFRDDEIHHHHLAEENKAMEAPLYRLLYNTIKTGCQAAIWLTKRF